MRWQVIACTARVASAGLGQVVPQLPDLPCQRLQFLLLTHDDLVELLDQVFGETGFDFQIGQAIFHTGIGNRHRQTDSAGFEANAQYVRRIDLLKAFPHRA